MRSQGSTDLEHIQIIKKVGGKLTDSYLDEGEIPRKYFIKNYAELYARLHSRQNNRRQFAKADGRRQNIDRKYL
jgi:hypothetical protein